MKTKLNNLIQYYWGEKKRLQELKNRYFTIIYKSALKLEKVQKIHKRLLQETINSKMPNTRLLQFSFRLANKVDKMIKAQTTIGVDLIAIKVIDLFKKKAVNYSANLLINQYLRDDEAVKKDKILQDTFSEGLKTGKIFYIASSHKDCAPDHLIAQGKLFVDEKYKQIDKTGEIEKFVKKNNIQTVQYIIGAPVYFITRPNCRHYFVQKSFDEIKNGYTAPYKKIGDRKFQTPAKASYEYYLDRYNMLKELYKTHKTEELKNLLLKTKILKEKWYNNGKF